jgi:hypothetical protein
MRHWSLAFLLHWILCTRPQEHPSCFLRMVQGTLLIPRCLGWTPNVAWSLELCHVYCTRDLAVKRRLGGNGWLWSVIQWGCRGPMKHPNHLSQSSDSNEMLSLWDGGSCPSQSWVTTNPVVSDLTQGMVVLSHVSWNWPNHRSSQASPFSFGH